MTGPNGHAHEPAPSPSVTATAALVSPAVPQFSPERIKEVVAKLEVPFDASQIEWRVMNTTKNGQPMRGQVIPYSDQRAYTDRLNALFTPAGWTRKYTIHTSASFERSRDQKIVAKVLVTCEVTIFGLGSHSATGEEWADDDNAVTAAEAQSFKRAAACFGLGRYLYYFDGVWVDLDDRKRPRTVPSLPQWATPEGWRKGMRPNKACTQGDGAETTGCHARVNNGPGNTQSSELVRQIEAMAKPLGCRLYRGILRTLAKVWNPDQISDVVLQRKILEQMQSAERGLGRLHAALAKTVRAARRSATDPRERTTRTIAGEPQTFCGEAASPDSLDWADSGSFAGSAAADSPSVPQQASDLGLQWFCGRDSR